MLQYLTKNASRVLGFSQQLLCLQVCDKINVSTQCLKITENVSFYIASEASYVYILSGQKLIKNVKNDQNWKIQMRHFW